MDSYRKTLELTAAPAAVYEALTTTAGIRGWWTTTGEVAGGRGGSTTVSFGPTRKVFRHERLDPARLVHWHCVAAHLECPGVKPDEWVGTDILFRLAPQAAGTRLDVEHRGLVPALTCWTVCEKGWDQFLGSLQAYLDHGRGQPFVPDGPCASSEAAGDPARVEDAIERSILIAAPRSRVWRLLADAERFGQWFGVNLAGQRFAVGQPTRGPITIEGYTHVTFDVVTERIEPESLIAWRWHPYAVDPKVDYSSEPRTLVTFTLADVPEGTRVKVVESGFAQVPPDRRFEAFRMNTLGWDAQVKSLRDAAQA